jgi:sarcosine oxidase subunit beta
LPLSTEAPRSTSVAIIGGGIMGLSLAWHLARQGQRDVTVFEARSVGSGASGRSGALLRQHYSNRHEAFLAHESLGFYKRWADIVHPTPVHTATPLVVTVPTGAGFEQNIDHLRLNVQMQRSLGIQTRIVTADELRALQPYARIDDLRCAALEAESGYVDAPASTRALALAVRRMGVRIVEHCPVTGVTVAHGRVSGIEVSQHAIRTEAVVCAAGPWSQSILRSAGILLPIEAIRVQVVVLQRPLRLEPPHFAYVDMAAGFFARPYSSGRTLVGIAGGDQHDAVNPEGYREAGDDNYPTRARATLARRFPAMREATPCFGWAGLYDMTPDAHPVIGRAGPDGLYVMAGFSGAGFKKAPAVGVALAEMILDAAEKRFDLTPFALDRFRDGKWRRPWSETEYELAADFGHAL